jgi:hypothetical protein
VSQYLSVQRWEQEISTLRGIGSDLSAAPLVASRYTDWAFPGLNIISAPLGMFLYWNDNYMDDFEVHKGYFDHVISIFPPCSENAC